jgi:hypothetical protein
VLKKAIAAVVVASIAVLAGLIAFGLYSDASIRATSSERSRVLAGDEFIASPIATVTHAITIHRPPKEVWPWLAQMGSGRAGWYAYDFIDNGGRASATRILPQFQAIREGTIFPALPGAKDVFVVLRCDADRELVLAWLSPDATYFTTWAFVLDEPQPNVTRLIVRGHAGPEYHPFGLPLWLTRRIAPLAHAIMEREQLLGIRRRAEASVR